MPLIGNFLNLKSKENPLGLFDDLVCVTPINPNPGYLRDEERPTPDHSKDPCLGLQLAGMSLRCGSMTSTSLPAQKSAPKPDCKSRQNSSKCSKKASASFHRSCDSKKSNTRKVANNPVPSTSESEDLDSTVGGSQTPKRRDR